MESTIGNIRDFSDWARYYDPTDTFRDINARFK